MDCSITEEIDSLSCSAEIACRVFPDPDEDVFHYFLGHGLSFAVHSETRNPVVGEILGNDVVRDLAVQHDDPKTTIVLSRVTKTRFCTPRYPMAGARCVAPLNTIAFI
jgi:hypothetical protein